MAGIPASPAVARWPRTDRGGMGLAARVLLAGIALLVLWPAAVLVTNVFSTATGAERLFDTSLGPVFWNTFVVVGTSSLAALVFGTALAWINERTDGGLKGIGNFMPVAPLLLPSITGVLGWVVLFDPRVGLVNVALRWLTGQPVGGGEGPFNIYSMMGLIFAMAVHMVPAVYLVVAAALRNLDPALEEAARIFGSGPVSAATRVLLPAIRPALFEAWMLGLIKGIGIFSVPVILGTGAGIEVVSVKIWTYLSGFPSNQPAAIVLVSLMLAVVLGLRFIQWLLAPGGTHATIGGKGVRGTPTRLGWVGHLTRALVIFYILLSLVLPVIGLFIVSLEQFWTANIPWDRLSFANYTRVLTQNPLTIRALANSLLLAAVGATLVMAIAGFLMLYAHQSEQTGRRNNKKTKIKRARPAQGFRAIADLVTSIPATVPHSLVAVAFILAFSSIYGTIWLLLLAYVLMEIPYGTSAARSATSVLGKELGEASRIFRASPGRTMRSILLPLVMPGLAAGWVLVFIHILGEVTASAILSGTANPVVGSVLLDLWRQGNFPMMTAFALIIWLIASALVIVLLRLNNRMAETR